MTMPIGGTRPSRVESAPGPGFETKLAGWQSFFASWRFATVGLGLLLTFEVWMLALTLFPASSTGLGAFAEQFRVWCLGYDSTSGKLEWAYVVAMMVHPAVLGVIMTWLWWKPLTEQLRTRARSLVPLGATSVAIGTALLVLLAVVNPAPAQMLEFPAQALRTEHAAPDIDLTSQEGQAFSLGSLRGEVVLLTGIYASCGQACPLVMAEMKRVLAKLDANERRQVRSVIITLNPEHDDVEVLAKLARHYGVTAPAFTFLTGPAPKVHDTLDRLQILRKKDAASGVIDHTSLFFTIDRKGRIAYRFALGEGQEQWLVEALKVLLAEPA